MVTEYSKLLELNQAVRQIDSTINDKLSYWVEKLKDKLSKYINNYNKLVREINIKYCTEKDGVILTDANSQFKFTKDNLLLLEKEVEQLQNSKVEVEEFNCFCSGSDRAKDLSLNIKLALEGYLFEEITIPEA